MADIWSIAWSFEYALLPCLAAYIVFEIPIIIRRITRKLYVPVYFAFFPFGYSDELYAKYFDDDDWFVVGGPFRGAARKTARMRIIWVSMLSLVATMAFSPFAAALFSAYALTDSQFVQFMWTLGLVKGVLLLSSLYDLRFTYKVTDIVPISHISLVYLVYWGVLLVFTDRAKSWIEETISASGIWGVFSGLLDFLVFDIGVGVLLVAVLGFLIPWRLTAGGPRGEDSS